MKDEIYKKAKEILIQKRIKKRELFNKQKRDKRVIEAGLCPCCGEKLILLINHKEIKKYIKNNNININSNYDYYKKLKSCPKDIKHYLSIKGCYFNDEE